VFRRRRFFEGRPTGRRGDGLADMAWLRPNASEMTEQDWSAGFGRTVAVFLNGETITDVNGRGEGIYDYSFLLFFSAHDEPIDFEVPAHEYGTASRIVLDTTTTEVSDEQRATPAPPCPSARAPWWCWNAPPDPVPVLCTDSLAPQGKTSCVY
jgi:isoamylase